MDLFVQCIKSIFNQTIFNVLFSFRFFSPGSLVFETIFTIDYWTCLFYYYNYFMIWCYTPKIKLFHILLLLGVTWETYRKKKRSHTIPTALYGKRERIVSHAFDNNLWLTVLVPRRVTNLWILEDVKSLGFITGNNDVIQILIKHIFVLISTLIILVKHHD